MGTRKFNQNKTLRAGVAFTIMALITLVALSFTFAKYVFTGTGTDNARVAKWGLNIPIDSDLKLFSDAYKADGTPSAYDASGNIVKAGNQNQRVIAPGTHNTVDAKLANDTAPEVMYDFNIKLKIEDLTTQPGTTQESLIQLLDNYAPWKWTLGDQEFNDFLAFENAVNNLTQKDVPPNHLPDTKNIILGWKWDFDDDGAGTYDTYDTSMGNAAVVDAITHLKVSLNVEAVQCQGCTPATKTLTGITVTNAPTKIVYDVGDAFDPAGMVITASYSDGATADVTGYTFSPETLNIPGEQTVTIFYTEGGVTKTTSLQVTVKVFEKATVKTPPSSIPSLTYNGNPQTIANPGEAENGTMMYAVNDRNAANNDNFFTQILNNIGDVVDNLLGNRENKESTNVSTNFKINDGSDLTVNKLTCNANTSAGTYNLTLIAYDEDDENHNTKEIEVNTITWTVKEKPATISNYVVCLWEIDHNGDHVEGQHSGTFGLVTGSWSSSLRPHTCGNPHCINKDSWEVIIKNIQEGHGQEYYGECIKEGCTNVASVWIGGNLAADGVDDTRRGLSPCFCIG